MGKRRDLEIAVKTQARMIRELTDELEDFRSMRESYHKEQAKVRELTEVLAAWGIADSQVPEYSSMTTSTSAWPIVVVAPNPERQAWLRQRWKMDLTATVRKELADQIQALDDQAPTKRPEFCPASPDGRHSFPTIASPFLPRCDECGYQATGMIGPNGERF